jgi:hypothetical protein
MGGFRDKELMAKMDPFTLSGTWAGPKVTFKYWIVSLQKILMRSPLEMHC